MQTTTGRSYHEVRSFSTLPEMIRQSVALYGDLAAFKFRHKPHSAEITKTYRDFYRDFLALSAALMSLELSRKRIAILGKNSYGWAVAYYAAINSAGVVIPLDAQLPENEIKRLLERGRAEVLFYDHKHEKMAHSIQKQSGLPFIFSLETADEERHPVAGSINDLIREGQEKIDDQAGELSELAIDPNKLSSLIFTSGTTSDPKGVMLSQQNICSNVGAIAGILPLYPKEKLLSILPLHHTFENTAGFHYPLYCGACICYSDGLRYFIKNMKEWQIENMIAVPLLFENIYEKIIDQLAASNRAFKVRLIRPVVRSFFRRGVDIRRRIFQGIIEELGGRLRTVVVGAASIDKTIIQTFNDFGIDFFMGYGLTESAPVISCCHPAVNVIGSVGTPLPGVEVAIDREAGSLEEFGEILTRSDSVMLGYEGDPEATAAALTPDGWLRTGDVGYIDKRGSLHLTGRLKSVIVLPNGKKVFPEEIEILVNQFDGVVNSMVWGEEAAGGGVTVCALIQLEQDLIADATQAASYLSEEIRQLNQTLPTYKRIKYYLMTREDFILTTTFKIKRAEQKKQIEHWLSGQNLSMAKASGRVLIISDDQIR